MRLFGSRVDDSKRGGDIDLYLEIPDLPDWFEAKSAFQYGLYRALGDRKIDIVIHPQSVIHSLVEFVDGSVLAQLGSPDMRVPIAHALAWPERMATPAERLKLADIGTFDQMNQVWDAWVTPGNPPSRMMRFDAAPSTVRLRASS